jgi:hypothetical protein
MVVGGEGRVIPPTEDEEDPHRARRQ